MESAASGYKISSIKQTVWLWQARIRKHVQYISGKIDSGAIRTDGSGLLSDNIARILKGLVKFPVAITASLNGRIQVLIAMTRHCYCCIV